ncbi:MAG: Fe-S cluster assembly scaffold protein NifU [Planctomycetes bacterium]|nr:Fe-S cluster assembly scaffold protein NifU [Planctomycetota bacterium]
MTSEFSYTEEVMEHFMNPKNIGQLEDADGVGEVGNPVCGDVMKIYIKVEDEHIVDVRFQTFGCAAAIATSSIMTEMVKGKTIEEALTVSNEAVTEALGGLPAQKKHCSVLAEEALEAAVLNYRGEDKDTSESGDEADADSQHD